MNVVVVVVAYFYCFWFALCCVRLAAGDPSRSDCISGCKCIWRNGKKAVECTDKGLIMIPDGIDQDTLVLDVSGNNLQILPRETFQRTGLVNMQNLYLKSCRLGQIDDSAFKGLTNLVELDLSYNLLTYVPSHAFLDIPNLRVISLAKNPIQKLDPFSFRPLPNLNRLDLANCTLQWIGPKAFDGLEMLDYLRLNGNQLTTLPGSTVNTLHKLRTIELHGNNWKCDCNLRTTKMWIQEHKVHIPFPIYCTGGPERLRNESFLDVSADEFACRPQIKVDSRYVEAISDGNATIECRVESDPVAKISWYWNGRSLANYSLFSPNQRIFVSQTGENIYDMRSKLIITKVEASDMGQYYCVAENKAGSEEANFTLNVIPPSVRMSVFDSSHINTLTVAFAVLIVFMLLVIVLLIRKLRRSSSDSSPEDDKFCCSGNGKIGVNGSGNNNHHHHNNHNNANNNANGNEKSNSSDTSSTTERSRDSVYKSESGKAFTITSDLSYSRSLSDIGNPQFSNPDLINSATHHMHHAVAPSGCETPLPITRPISDYSQNWQRSYDLQQQPNRLLLPPPPLPAVSAVPNGYDMMLDPRLQCGLMVDTVSGAGSVSDEVFINNSVASRLSDYPADYGLPILPENGTLPQPCAKTLKVWQRGVPVYPPMCGSSATLPHHQISARNSPAVDPRCGTDV